MQSSFLFLLKCNFMGVLFNSFLWPWCRSLFCRLCDTWWFTLISWGIISSLNTTFDNTTDHSCKEMMTFGGGSWWSSQQMTTAWRHVQSLVAQWKFNYHSRFFVPLIPNMNLNSVYRVISAHSIAVFFGEIVEQQSRWQAFLF